MQCRLEFNPWLNHKTPSEPWFDAVFSSLTHGWHKLSNSTWFARNIYGPIDKTLHTFVEPMYMYQNACTNLLQTTLKHAQTLTVSCFWCFLHAHLKRLVHMHCATFWVRTIHFSTAKSKLLQASSSLNSTLLNVVTFILFCEQHLYGKRSFNPDWQLFVTTQCHT